MAAILKNKDEAQSELEFVHEVYDEIALHFSETRYKLWPLVQEFLLSLEGDVVNPNFICDVGCGNGKYLHPFPHSKNDFRSFYDVIYDQELQLKKQLEEKKKRIEQMEKKKIILMNRKKKKNNKAKKNNGNNKSSSIPSFLVYYRALNNIPNRELITSEDENEHSESASQNNNKSSVSKSKKKNKKNDLPSIPSFLLYYKALNNLPNSTSSSNNENDNDNDNNNNNNQQTKNKKERNDNDSGESNVDNNNRTIKEEENPSYASIWSNDLKTNLTPSLRVGCDRSIELLNICKKKNLSTVRSDILALPYRDNFFDGVICIAVLHHLVNPERRKAAIKEMIRILRPGGSLLCSVWAFEQKKKKYDEQDVLIPWSLQSTFDKELQKKKQESKKEKQFISKKKKKNFIRTQKHQEKKERENDNNNNNNTGSDINQGTIKETSDDIYKVYHRYYHLFKANELENLFLECSSDENNIKIKNTTYDRDNWYVIVEKLP